MQPVHLYGAGTRHTHPAASFAEVNDRLYLLAIRFKPATSPPHRTGGCLEGGPSIIPLARDCKRPIAGIPHRRVSSVDMLLSTAEDLAAFVSELQKESDRGLALVGAALIDEKLKETLRAFFVEGKVASKLLDQGNGTLGSMSTRIDLCNVLGLLDDYERREIDLLRKIRNEFAHSIHGLTFKSGRVAGLCSSLTSELPADGDYPLTDPRFRYTNATVCIILRVYHRPDWVALERRKVKSWVDNDATKWQSLERDTPPPGISPVMAIGRLRRRDPRAD
ncbi:hypothetical protein [Sphingosinicella sp. LY1275]|uniref:hypothetical protein n=1 Tax=Sphingosinicella sp. LY1275 TaxID=3095379 RepID=UPI002ADECCF7|nr:hypothetical protein [Sphingosinicella sp. LY1275]MEA1015140.1 hypothetical protein [Sphingosinicella sp. LY1275]